MRKRKHQPKPMQFGLCAFLIASRTHSNVAYVYMYKGLGCRLQRNACEVSSGSKSSHGIAKITHLLPIAECVDWLLRSKQQQQQPQQ